MPTFASASMLRLMPASSMAKRSLGDFISGICVDHIEMERLERLGGDLTRRHASLYERLKEAGGLHEEFLEA